MRKLVIITVVLVLVSTLLFCGCGEKDPCKGFERGGKCVDNMRTIDGAIMTYRANTGEWPDSSILTNTDYLKDEPICPCGTASYIWHESINGEAPYFTCPNIDKCPSHAF